MNRAPDLLPGLCQLEDCGSGSSHHCYSLQAMRFGFEMAPPVWAQCPGSGWDHQVSEEEDGLVVVGVAPAVMCCKPPAGTTGADVPGAWGDIWL